MPDIVIIAASQAVSSAEINHWVGPLAVQLNEHYAPAYGQSFGGTLHFAEYSQTINPDWWQLVITDNSTMAGALGFHDDVTPGGQPRAKVFAAVSLQYGVAPSSVASHELLEMREDPELDQLKYFNHRYWADEACDAVEADGYWIDDVWVSNFVLPAWYGAVPRRRLRYDYLGYLMKPRTMTMGGYCQWYNPHTGWHQLTNFEKAPDAEGPPHFAAEGVTMMPGTSGRSARRREVALPAGVKGA